MTSVQYKLASETLDDIELDTAATKLSLFSAGADYHRLARRSKAQGAIYSAAMQLRNAAVMFADDDWLEELCWCEWESIMQLGRRFAASVL